MENLRTVGVVLTLPVVCIWRFALSCVAKRERKKTWRRVLVDSIFRWVVSNHSLPRLQYLLGKSEDIYIKWAKRNDVKTFIEDIGANGKLLWILNEESRGKIPDRVILYLHGGGFYLPMFEDSASFWYYVQKQLKDSHQLDVGIAILDYSLLPGANFPVPLLQSVHAIQHLFSCGLKSSNIILTGDSAGGNLTIQVLLHILHPLTSVPKLIESAAQERNPKFAGAYLMSPWMKILPREEASQKCFRENKMWDVVSHGIISKFATELISGIEEDGHLPYIDSFFAPSDWYDGIGSLVNRMLISAGGSECFRDDIIEFAKELERVSKEAKVELVVDKFGVHDDPFFDFMARESKLGEMTPKIVSWCHDAFSL